MRITDLDEFSLSHVWRPYQNMIGFEGATLKRPVLSLDGTADRLRNDTHWSKSVLDRARQIGLEFPAYVQHPLVDVLIDRAGARRLAPASPTPAESP